MTATDPRRIDTLIRNATIITMDRERRVLLDGSLAIDRGRIVAVGPGRDVDPSFAASVEIDGRDFVITPGFINGHVHITGDPLTRGFMPDTIDYRDPDTFAKIPALGIRPAAEGAAAM